jgi:hypothetical protein
MNKTFALQHPMEPSRDPHTLGTVAVSLVACSHPEPSQLRAADEAAGAAPIWCAACGALRFGEGPASRWQRPALPSLLTKKHFDDFVLLLHSIRHLARLAGSQSPTGAAGSRADSVLRSLRTTLLAVARLPVVQGLDGLEAALAEMTFDRTGKESR